MSRPFADGARIPPWSQTDLHLTAQEVLETHGLRVLLFHNSCQMLAQNPYGVPISTGTWGGSGAVTHFAMEAIAKPYPG